MIEGVQRHSGMHGIAALSAVQQRRVAGMLLQSAEQKFLAGIQGYRLR